MAEGLTGAQIKFAEGILDGLSQAEAYKRAYPKATKSIDSQASRLAKNAKVLGYITQMREKAKSEKVWGRQKVLEYLTAVAATPVGQIGPDDELCQSHSTSETKFGTNERIEMPSKLEALKMLNKMQGYDAPQKVEVEASDGLAQLLAEISGKTAGL